VQTSTGIENVMKVITTTATDCASAVSNQAQDRVHSTADFLYAAECAFHDAHQTRIDAWIMAAADKLHTAIAAHLTAIADSNSSPSKGLNH
jgi:hypothetical protein